jgi:hypothetical protein
LVIGLFLSCRYSFSGDAARDVKTSVNNVMDTAANAAEGLKQEIKQACDSRGRGDDEK